MTLTLHQHPFAAYCWKALIALHERGVPFTAALVDGEDGRAALAALWPPASIPVLVDAGAGLVLPESTVIVEYLDGHGPAAPIVPVDPAGARTARLWDRVVDGQVATPMQKIVLDALRAPGAHDPTGVAEAGATLDRAYALLDSQLADTAWLAGERFTLADCAAAPALHYGRVVRPWDPATHVHLTRYVDALLARPSVARVVDDARPFRALFPLPWPEGAG